MKIAERKKIWIHRLDGSNDLNICAICGGGEIFCGDGKNFSVREAEELFEVIKNAIQSKYPNLVVNPWSDAKPGTLD